MNTKKISKNKFLASAIMEKVTALETETYLTQRGLLGSKKKFQNILDKVPYVEPEEYDK